MKTRRGIFTNLDESDFIFSINGLRFYFSSEYYLKKFMNNFRNYIELESQKIHDKFNINIDFKLFLAVALYKKIEKRGFKVEYKNVPISKHTIFLAKLWGDKE